MAKLQLVVPSWDQLGAQLDLQERNHYPITANQLLTYIAFGPDRPSDDGIWADAYLRDEVLGSASSPKQHLCGHPIACRSFATFLPSRSITFSPFRAIKATNLYGLTVWDVQEAFQQFLDDHVTVHDMIQYLQLVPNYQLAFPSGCDILEVLRSLQTLRGFFSYMGIESIDLDDFTPFTQSRGISRIFSISPDRMHFLGAIRGSAAETSIFFLRILGSPSHARLETLPPRHPAASKTFPRARIANRGFESDARMSTFNRVIDVDIAWGPKLGNIVWVCLNNFLISNPNRSFWACFAASQRMTTVGTMQPTYHDGRPRSSILQILPVELLSEIKSHIPLHDLFTLVCFYKTCTKFAQLFGSVQTQAKFWESACLLAGLGCLPGERAEEVDWKHVAFDCIERDGSCKHPECGRARLEWNEADKMADTTSLAPVPTWETFDALVAQGNWSTTCPNEAIRGIALAKHSFTDIGEDAYLRQYNDIHDEKEESDENLKQYLWDHPIACRSFATFPPTRSMCVFVFEDSKRVQNENGVTVWDEICGIRKVFNRTADVHEIASVLFDLKEYIPLIFKEGCPLTNFFNPDDDVSRGFYLFRIFASRVGGMD
ncbi:hypothetical protein NLI96_g3362 [Meripilus lineatus]|uniref:F-box domain-containing protein n=1 Tax=Meripilus lineatus TaxID=2056292 RepID=A0AAD5V6Z5_9APHY|nr:hypothetical protein NLI96_g3362 [Physisporinus lineatus]